MAENGWFDPMILESRLPYYPETLEKTPLVVRVEATVVEADPGVEITEAGATGTSSSDLSQSPELGDGSGTQVGEENGPGTLTQPIGNGRTVLEQEEEGEDAVLNPPSKGSKKRRNWLGVETDLLMTAVASEKTKSKSRLDKERFYDGVAKGVPGRTGTECRRRVETLKKSYKVMKEHCDKEKKEFAELIEAGLGKIKLATCINESWYNQIRDHCPPRRAKRSRAQGPGSCPSLSGEVGLVVGGFDNSGVFSTNIVSTTASGPPPVIQSPAASAMVRNGGKSSEAWNGRLGELSMMKSERRHGALPVVWVSVWCG